ncbi:MAG: uncharacterized protein KVP18_004025 [Porospora cf. gigantea A]|uniref:uncharacterized protein n=1 Tax=Porospora cf. gigantea A TaxID=2853593 RepID=UPI0035598927|nr:MAG: hypothetical protein KVP18_004025 [Porospora cf. gigantea A]
MMLRTADFHARNAPASMGQLVLFASAAPNHSAHDREWSPPNRIRMGRALLKNRVAFLEPGPAIIAPHHPADAVMDLQTYRIPTQKTNLSSAGVRLPESREIYDIPEVSEDDAEEVTSARISSEGNSFASLSSGENTSQDSRSSARLRRSMYLMDIITDHDADIPKLNGKPRALIPQQLSTEDRKCSAINVLLSRLLCGSNQRSPSS